MYLKGFEVTNWADLVVHHDDPCPIKVKCLKGENGKPLYDIRRWSRDIPGEGVTMTAEEAKTLYCGLHELFPIELISKSDPHGDTRQQNPQG